MINTPFNYTGSKYKLLDQIKPLFDYTKPLFIDLFAGGGSVYTNVVDKYQRVLVNDIIDDLIGIHKQLINNPDEIIEEVKRLSIPCKDSQEKYNELRKSYNDEKTPEKLWSLLLCSTNNMIRFNKRFDYNQTWGKRSFNFSTQKKVDEFVNYISKYKNKIYFSSVNFYDVPIKSDGMYYCDPPYLGTEAGYNAFWSQTLETKLYNYLRELNQKGASFALSGVLNHNDKSSKLITKLIEDGFKYEILNFNYNKVSRIGNKNTDEILIMNY